MSRSFTVDAIFRNGKKLSIEGGRYMSTSPSGAARKAFTQAYRQLNVKGKITLILNIRETTQGSSHKIHKYKVSRVSHPTEATWIDDSVVFKYTTKIHSV